MAHAYAVNGLEPGRDTTGVNLSRPEVAVRASEVKINGRVARRHARVTVLRRCRYACRPRSRSRCWASRLVQPSNHEDIAGDGGAGVSADDVRVLGRADLSLKVADSSEVAAPEEAAGAEEAAVELLDEDSAEGGADGGAAELGLTEQPEPQVGCLFLNLHSPRGRHATCESKRKQCVHARLVHTEGHGE